MAVARREPQIFVSPNPLGLLLNSQDISLLGIRSYPAGRPPGLVNCVLNPAICERWNPESAGAAHPCFTYDR